MNRTQSLHAMLITRIALVATAISIIVAVVVVASERSRVLRVASDRALIRAGTLRELMLKHLDTPGLGDRAEILTMLKSIAYKGGDLDTGHYVFVRVLDPSSNEVARTADSTHENIAALVRHVDSKEFSPPFKTIGPEIVRKRILNTNYLHARGALLNSRNEISAFVEGYFATSREEEQKMFLELLRAIALAVGTVIITALLLYPVIVQLMRRLERLSRNLIDSNLEALRVVGSTIAKRDSDTDIHNFRVTIYAVRMAEALGFDNQTIRVLIRGAFLHDVGKIGIRDSVLLKPGRLDEAEFNEMKKHVNHGIDIVTRSSWLGEALPVVGSHHEKFGGGGYPDGVAGGDIPAMARIFAIADVFDALTSRRPYKEPNSFEESIDILMQGRGTHFDPEFLDLFISIARPLFDLYGNKEDDRAYNDLSSILDRYYKADIASFLE